MADVALQPLPQQAEAVTPWSLPRRVLFRFLFCYWLLYGLPESGRVNVLGSIPGSQFAIKYVNLWHAIVPWVATHVFHVTGRAATYFVTGSGDTTLQYIHNLLYLVVSLVATIVWSILDRRRTDYRTLDGWLRLLVRYTLALTLLGYGFAKVFPLQFRPPYLGKLVEPYGEFSPMGVLWSFMGASIPYTIFSGAAEVTGGLLLLFRRTASLGAMVSFAVLLNVAALNYCYDVPVKLYSTNLLLMAVFLAASDFGRLANVLVLNRAAAPADLTGPRFESHRLRMAAIVFWVLFVGYNLFGHITGGWEAYRSAYLTPQRPPLYGLYDVESGPANWRKVIVAFPTALVVRTTDDKALSFAAQYENNTITLDKKDQLAWSWPDPDHVVLQGNFNGSASTIRLRRIDTGKFPLLSRGFHWINETPFNR
jgi:hypothetical protein